MTISTKISDELQFTSRGLKIKARQFGNLNGIKVLGLHGWLDNASTFELFAPFLDQIHLIAIDLPGHGLSGHRARHSSYYLWEYVTDVLEVLKKLKWQKAHLLAHSMGTGIAAVLAASFPQKVDKLCFLDGLGPAFVSKDDDSILEFYKKSVRHLELAYKANLYGFSTDENYAAFKTKEEAILNRMKGFSGSISRTAAETLVNRSLQKVKNGYNWRHDPRLVLPNYFRVTEKQAQLILKHIEAPVQLILGTEGLFSDRKLQNRIDQFKHLDLHEIAGNHHFHLDTPRETSQIIKSFLLTGTKK